MERRVSFDRAVWTKPLAFAADAAFQLCGFNRGSPWRGSVRRRLRSEISSRDEVQKVIVAARALVIPRADRPPAHARTVRDERGLADQWHRL